MIESSSLESANRESISQEFGQQTSAPALPSNLSPRSDELVHGSIEQVSATSTNELQQQKQSFKYFTSFNIQLVLLLVSLTAVYLAFYVLGTLMLLTLVVVMYFVGAHKIKLERTKAKQQREKQMAEIDETNKRLEEASEWGKALENQAVLDGQTLNIVESKLSKLVELVNDVGFNVDGNWIVTHFTPAAIDFFGRDMTNKPLGQLLPDWNTVAEGLKRSTPPEIFEISFLDGKDQPKRVDLLATRDDVDPNGWTFNALGAYHVPTPAEKNAASRLAAIEENSPALTLTITRVFGTDRYYRPIEQLEASIEAFTPAASLLYGDMSKAPCPFEVLFAEDEKSNATEMVKSAFEQKGSGVFSAVHRNTPENTFDVELEFIPLSESTNSITIMVFVRDQSEIKMLREEIGVLTAKVQQLESRLSCKGIAYVDVVLHEKEGTLGHPIYKPYIPESGWHPNAKTAFGYDEGEGIKSMYLSDLFGEGADRIITELTNAILAGESRQWISKEIRKGESLIAVGLSKSSDNRHASLAICNLNSMENEHQLAIQKVENELAVSNGKVKAISTELADAKTLISNLQKAFQNRFETMPYPVVLLNERSNVEQVSKQFMKLVRSDSKESLIGKSISDFLTDPKTKLPTIDGEHVEKFDLKATRLDKTTFSIAMSATKIENQIAIFVYDISEFVSGQYQSIAETEEELIKNKEDLSRLIDIEKHANEAFDKLNRTERKLGDLDSILRHAHEDLRADIKLLKTEFNSFDFDLDSIESNERDLEHLHDSDLANGEFVYMREQDI